MKIGKCHRRIGSEVDPFVAETLELIPVVDEVARDVVDGGERNVYYVVAIAEHESVCKIVVLWSAFDTVDSQAGEYNVDRRAVAVDGIIAPGVYTYYAVESTENNVAVLWLAITRVVAELVDIACDTAGIMETRRAVVVSRQSFVGTEPYIAVVGGND